MNLVARIAALLSLSGTADEDEILSAVEAESKRVKSLESQLGTTRRNLAAVTAERDALTEAKLETEAKSFIDEAVTLGKIAPADADVWTALYAHDSTKAVTRMAERSASSATPVGRQRQTLSVLPPSATLAEQALAAHVDAALTHNGINPAVARRAAQAFGLSADQVTKHLAATVGVSEEV